MGFQFIHIQSVARQASTQKKAGRTTSNVRSIIAEAGREPKNCPHVQSPKPPQVLHGSLKKAESEANEWAETTKNARGQKLKQDAHCLLAGVASLPDAMAQDFDQFARLTVDFLKNKYGERLRAVVAHRDEAHPHLHFYAVPLPGERFDAIHEGERARNDSRARKEVTGKQNEAYIEAMRVFQDEFAQKVGKKVGLTRIGPARQRITREQWKAQQQQAKALADVEKSAEKRKKFYKAQATAKAQQEVAEQAQETGFKVANMFRGFAHGLKSESKKEREGREALEREIEREKEALQLEADERQQQQTTENKRLRDENKELRAETHENKKELEMLREFKKEHDKANQHTYTRTNATRFKR